MGCLFREFTWGFGLNEPYPRDQYNGYIAISEAGSRGAMARIADEPNLRKFTDPTVQGVDFPTVCLSQAIYDIDRRSLIVSTDAGLPPMPVRPLHSECPMSNLKVAEYLWTASSRTDWRALDGEIEITTTVGQHTFIISQQG